MKKRIIISLLCGLVICCVAVYSFGNTGIVNTDTLRLRKSNTTDSSIITLLSIDDKVEILARTENNWYKVKYIDSHTKKEYEGYVSGEYITIKDGETIPTIEKSEENETSKEENNNPSQEENNNSSEEVGTEEKVEESTTKIINNGERVYKIPLINSNTTNILKEDITVEVIAELNGWSYVKSNTFEGWIRKEKLQETNAKNKIGYINANQVNFREQPNTSGEPISTLTRNEEVEIIEENNGWTKVKYKGTLGYISTKYLSSSKVETTSRSSSSRRTNTVNTQISSNENAKTETTELITDAEQVSNSDTSNIVAYAKNYLGCKYVYGGSSPSGFDCSGFTQYVYKHFGYSLSRTTTAQAKNGTAVNKSNLQLGDVLCFSGSSNSKNVTHVGIYIGGGKFIHAANPRKGVIISRVDGDGFFYVSARRIIN